MGRRAFVKGMAAGAAVGAAGAAGLAVWRWGLGPPQGPPEFPRTVRYAGARVLPGSPADIGVPIIDIRADQDGYLRAVVTDLDPFRYCARRPDATVDDIGDGYLRYHVSDERVLRAGVPGSQRWWYFDRRGERIHVDHFRERAPLDGAVFVWGDADQPNPFTGVLVKVPVGEIAAEGAARLRLLQAVDPRFDLVAFDAACTHLCCTAGWHEDPTAEKYGSWDTIFCSCHNARFDPRRVEPYAFELRRPESSSSAPSSSGSPAAPPR